MQIIEFTKYSLASVMYDSICIYVDKYSFENLSGSEYNKKSKIYIHIHVYIHTHIYVDT